MTTAERKRTRRNPSKPAEPLADPESKTQAGISGQEVTPVERSLAEGYRQRRAEKPRPSRIRVERKGGTAEVRPDHPNSVIGSVLLMKAMGTDSFEFLDGLLAQITNVGSQGREPDERGINFVLSVVEGLQPRDEVEAMLAAQIAAVHMAAMTFARRLAHVENIPQQDSAERAFNKLTRTFTAQIDALKRYRNGGQQKVTVEHVHVHAGGQAIVGTVEQGGGVPPKNEEQPHAKQISHAPQSPLWSEDEKRQAVSIASDA